VKRFSHPFGLTGCAALALIAAWLWVLLWPTPIPDYQPFGVDYDEIDSERRIYIWLGLFSVLCFIWFFWVLKTKHD
jgi:hypothetical protein